MTLSPTEKKRRWRQAHPERAKAENAKQNAKQKGKRKALRDAKRVKVVCPRCGKERLLVPSERHHRKENGDLCQSCATHFSNIRQGRIWPGRRAPAP